MNNQTNSGYKQKNNLETTDNNKPIEKNISTSGGIVFTKGKYTTKNKNVDTQNNY